MSLIFLTQKQLNQLLLNKEVEFKLNSRDVIHSAYMPHFRAQMNCVPGMTTVMHFTPIYTTAQMRKDPDVIRQMADVNRMSCMTIFWHLNKEK